MRVFGAHLLLTGGPQDGETFKSERAHEWPPEIDVPIPPDVEEWLGGPAVLDDAPIVIRRGVYRAAHRVRRYTLDGMHQIDDTIVYTWEGLR